MKNGWQTKRLGEVCEIIKGRKPALKATASNGDLPYLVAKVIRGSAEAEYAAVKDRNSVTVKESETIIICDGSNSGEVFTGFRGILSSTMGKISTKAEIDDDYLRAFLASTFEIFNGAKTGAAIPHLDKEAMYALEFPLPPFAEQKRIVSIVNEAFAGIATAEGNTEKNLRNAKELFDSALESVFITEGNHWEEAALGELCDDLLQGINTATDRTVFVEDGVPILQAKEIGRDELDLGKCKFVAEKRFIEYAERYKPKIGDILYNNIGSSLGRSIEVNWEFPFTIAWNVMRIIPRREKIIPKYLNFCLQSPAVRESVWKKAKGVGMPFISKKDFSPIAIKYPSIPEQRKIVQRLEAVSGETRRLEVTYEQKLKALEALKKSLLHHAFSGQLK